MRVSGAVGQELGTETITYAYFLLPLKKELRGMKRHKE